MSQIRYEVLGKIADGGLGSVFKAYDRNLRREVALKRVRADSPEEAERQADQLFEEARTISTLQHPHIVTVFDVGKDEEGAFIVMELLKGETLEDIIQRGALNETDFRELATQSLEGMIAAHATGLIHLDIKPQNFMVIWLPSGKFQIKILDFGLAKLVSHPQVQDTNDDGSIMGSIFFMAPEQFERSPVDARTDLYSLGCVYYFALTQHYPFQGETGPEVMASHMYHSMIPLAQMRPDLPPVVCAWVEWLMSRDPNERPATVAQAHEWFQAGQAPTFTSPVTEAEGVALAEDDEYIATALPDDEVQPATPSQPVPPRIVRPGSLTSQMLRPTAPRPTRPVPGVPTGPVGTRPVPKPVMRPVNIVSAVAPEHLRPKTPLPKWLTLWLPLAVVLIAGSVWGFKLLKEKQERSRFDALVAQGQQGRVEGTPKDLALVIRVLDDKDRSQAAGELIPKLNAGEQVDIVLANAVRSVKNSWARKNLALAIAARGSQPALEPLLYQLDSVKEPDVRIAIWQALGRIAASDDVPRLLEKYKSDNIDEIRAAEVALSSAARKDGNAAKSSLAIEQAYRANTGGDEVQASLLRVLGKLGSPTALNDLKKALENPNLKIRSAAAGALGDWPTGEPIPALQAFAEREKASPSLRRIAFTSIGNLAPLSSDISQEDLTALLKAAYESSKDALEQVAILAALGRVTEPGTIEFLTAVSAREPRRKSMADAFVKTITTALGKVTAISNPSTVLAPEAGVRPLVMILKDGAVVNWPGLGDQINWLVKLDQPGEFEIKLKQAYTGPTPGRYTVGFGNAVIPKNVEKSSSATDFREVIVGRARFTKPGHYRLWIRPLYITPGDQLMRLKEVTLTRTGS